MLSAPALSDAIVWMPSQLMPTATADKQHDDGKDLGDDLEASEK